MYKKYVQNIRYKSPFDNFDLSPRTKHKSALGIRIKAFTRLLQRTKVLFCPFFTSISVAKVQSHLCDTIIKHFGGVRLKFIVSPAAAAICCWQNAAVTQPLPPRICENAPPVMNLI